MNKDNWISVDDSLPYFDISVFVYCRIMGRFLASLHRIEGTNSAVWTNWKGESGILPPTHWQPLPEPPEMSK